MKVLCIGDSLGLPREGCTYEETWFSLLKEAYPNCSFINQFEGGRLISNTSESFRNYYKYYKADVVILQTGIVDCAPRYINDKKGINILLRRMFNLVGLSRFYWRIVKSHVRKADCVYTDIIIFKKVYRELLDTIFESGTKAIVCVMIGHGAQSIIQASPFFNYNVDRYNNVIQSIANDYKNVYTVAPLNNVSEGLFVDGYHCNGNGMRMVFEELKRLIESETLFE